MLGNELLDFPAALPASKYASGMCETWILEVNGHRCEMDSWAYPFLRECWRQLQKDGVPFELRIDNRDPLRVDIESDVNFLVVDGQDVQLVEELDDADYQLFMDYFDSGEKHVYRLVDIHSNEIGFPRAQDVQ